QGECGAPTGEPTLWKKPRSKQYVPTKHQGIMKKRFILPLTLGLAALMTAGIAPAAQPGTDSKTANRPQEDQTSAIVVLTGAPLSTAPKTKPAQGKKIDFNSDSVKAVRARLNAVRRDFKSWLNQNAPNARVTGKFDISINAVSVSLN